MREAEFIGTPIKSVVYGNSHAVLGRSPGGREGMFYIAYYSTTGGGLVGYEPESGEHVKMTLGSAGGYGCCVGDDGRLYIGGISPGNLYAYDPLTGDMEDLGGSELGVQYIWGTVAHGRKVYGACYPTCSVIEYDIDTGELRDLGRADESQQYVRSICVGHGGNVWAGVGTRAHLVVYDLASGTKRDVLPEEYRHNSSCYDLQASGAYVLAGIHYDGVLLVFDTGSEELVDVVPRPDDSLSWMNCAGGPPGRPYLYSSPGGDLYQYDIEADRLTLLAEALGQCERVVDGRYVHGIDDQDYFLYDLQARQVLKRERLAEAEQGMRVFTLTGAPDGNLYGSTYINQHIFGYKPASGRLTDLGKVIRNGGQVDSIHAGKDGMLYLGSYIHATLSVYDPHKPWAPSRAPNGNPRELGMVGHGQYRTKAIALGPDDSIWVGSIPSYNSAPTGALSRWDPTTGEHESWLDLVPGGGVHAIACDGDYLYCAGGGRFFVWDPAARRKLHEEELGASCLAFAGGKIVGSAAAEVFLFDPNEMQVTSTSPSPIGGMSALAVAPGGSVYGISGEGIAEIDPISGAAGKVSAAGGHLIAVTTDGDVYFADGANLYRLAD